LETKLEEFGGIWRGFGPDERTLVALPHERPYLGRTPRSLPISGAYRKVCGVL
jgi:hypothetical protein